MFKIGQERDDDDEDDDDESTDEDFDPDKAKARESDIAEEFDSNPSSSDSEDDEGSGKNLKKYLILAMAYKYCTPEGTWETKHISEGITVNYTHYEMCIMPQIQELTEMCNGFGPHKCEEVSI